MKKIFLVITSILLASVVSRAQDYTLVSLSPSYGTIFLDEDGAGTVNIELDIYQMPPRSQVTRFEVIPVSVDNGPIEDWYAGSDVIFRMHANSSPMTMFRYIANIKMDFLKNPSIDARTCKFNFEVRAYSGNTQVFSRSTYYDLYFPDDGGEISCETYYIRKGESHAPIIGTEKPGRYEWMKNDNGVWLNAGNTQKDLPSRILEKTTQYKRLWTDEIYYFYESNIITITVVDDEPLGEPARYFAAAVNKNENYTVKYTPRSRVTTAPSFSNHQTNTTTVTYHDELGRPSQVSELYASPTYHDIIQPITYDFLGRDDAKVYLPYIDTYSLYSGTYKGGESQFKPVQGRFYGQYLNMSNDAFPDKCAYFENEYEISTIGRKKSSLKAGYEYRNYGMHGATEDHPATYSYTLNRASEVLDFRNSTIYKFTQSGYYPAGRLFKNTVTDEDGCVTVEFKDSRNKLILSRQWLNNTEYADTYYVYDHFDRLIYVVPPMAAEKARQNGGFDTQADCYKYCYAYIYDAAGNITTRNIPGKTENYAYTRANLVMAKISGPGETVYLNYDVHNRPIVEYLVTNSAIDTMAIYYYDEYFPTPSPKGLRADVDHRTKGYKTFEKIRIIDFDRSGSPGNGPMSGKWCMERYYYYDSKGRVVIMVSSTPEVTMDVRYTYNWCGDVTKTEETHFIPGKNELNIVTQNTYDHRSRLTNQSITVDGQSVSDVTYKYDELGKLYSKSYNGSNILPVKMEYDINGRLTSIGNDIFHQRLYYTRPKVSTKQYGGNIAEVGLSNGTGDETLYSYSYDKLGRLISAVDYKKDKKEDKFSEKDITYDKNGNILTLTRMEDSDYNKRTYTYDGDRLSGTHRDFNGTFSSTHNFSYDGYGNMTEQTGQYRDNNKFTYNFLNLPRVIDAQGLVTTDNHTYHGEKYFTTDHHWNDISRIYMGSVVYLTKDSYVELETIGFAEGRIFGPERLERSYYYTTYHITDHLGSVYAIVDREGRVIQRNDYYPFGLRIGNRYYASPENRYYFNGKEMHSSGTGLLDYGWRIYDPNLARWYVPDPHADKYHSHSSYAYVGNNPVNFTDPNGLEWLTAMDQQTANNLSADAGQSLNRLERQISRIDNQIASNSGKWSENKINQKNDQLKNLRYEANMVRGYMRGLEMMGETKDHVFTFERAGEGQKNEIYKNDAGHVVLRHNGEAYNKAHEATHGMQYMEGKIKFTGTGPGKTEGVGNYNLFGADMDAYRNQFVIYGPQTLPSDIPGHPVPNKWWEVNYDWVQAVDRMNRFNY